MDIDPEYTTKLLTKWVKDNKDDILEWQSRSPDLNAIHNWWEKQKPVCDKDHQQT